MLSLLTLLYIECLMIENLQNNIVINKELVKIMKEEAHGPDGRLVHSFFIYSWSAAMRKKTPAADHQMKKP